MPDSKLNGYFKWVVLLLPFVVAGPVGFFNVKSDVREVESSVQALESRVELQYQNILRELDTIKEMVRN